MSQELIYTSAPRGLKPGSHGFCTVVCTQNMPAGLVQRLESLSGYRHVFPLQDAKARLNPVLYSHLILNNAGRRSHVLSRICDAGLDHTQRTNKFAHHVVLDPRELPPGGPAWLLAQPGFMQTAWDGVPTKLPAGRRPPAGNSAAAVCRGWQQAAGDAGWGGALAETATANRAAVLIFRPGMDLLPLLAEALALLPLERRWNISFSTYFNKLPPGVDCQWRCVIEGSPDAIAADSPGALIIDLCKPQGIPAATPLVQAAQTGVAPVAAIARPAAYQASDAELAQLLAGAAAAPAELTDSLAGEVSESELHDLCAPTDAPDVTKASLPPMLRRPKRKPKSRWPIVAGAAAACTILIAGIVGFAIAQKRQRDVSVGTVAVKTDDPVPSKPSGEMIKAKETGEKPHEETAEERKKEPAGKIQEDPEKATLDKLTSDIDGFKNEAKSALEEARVHKQRADKKFGKAKTAAEKSTPDPDAAKLAADAANDEAAKTERAADKAAASANSAKNAQKKNESLADNRPNLSQSVSQAQQDADEARILAQAARHSTNEAKNMIAIAVAGKEKCDRRKEIVDSLHGLLKQVSLPKQRVAGWTNPFAIGKLSELGLNEYRLDLITNPNKDFVIELRQPQNHEEHRPIKWDCVLTQSSQAASGQATPTIIARFIIDGDKLSVQWDDMAGNILSKGRLLSDSLRNCILMISWKNEARARVQLRQCESSAPFHSLPSPPKNYESVDLPLEEFPEDAPIEVEPSNLAATDSDKSIPWKRDSEARPWTLAVGTLRPAHFSLASEKKTNRSSKRVLQLSLKFDGIDWNDDYKERIKGNCERRTNVTLPIVQDELRKVTDLLAALDRAPRPNQGEVVEKERQDLTKEIETLKELTKTHEHLLETSPLQYRIVMKVGEERIVLYSTEKSAAGKP